MGALERMHEKYPADDEVTSLLALSLVANSKRLTRTGLLMRSTALSMEVLRRNPRHPGAAHYLIHACDTPDHAILALPAARQYARIAPAASHALHMPSHIFVHLGLWRDVVASNEASWAASEKEVARWKKTDDDRDWHSYSWLVAGYLETDQRRRAEELVERLRGQLLTADGPFTRLGYALVTYALLNRTGRWDEAIARTDPLVRPLPAEPGLPADSVGCAAHAPGGSGTTRPPWGLVATVLAHQMRAEAAMRRGDEKALAEALGAKRGVIDGMARWKNLLPPELPERTARMEAAFTAVARARARRSPAADEAAVAALRRLAELRETVPNGPAFETPYQVLLGEFLLETGRPEEARTAFEAALERYPNLSLARAGMARVEGAAAR
jgi:tetratricopeptide (TPR) repeat protein